MVQDIQSPKWECVWEAPEFVPEARMSRGGGIPGVTLGDNDCIHCTSETGMFARQYKIINHHYLVSILRFIHLFISLPNLQQNPSSQKA